MKTIDPFTLNSGPHTLYRLIFLLLGYRANLVAYRTVCISCTIIPLPLHAGDSAFGLTCSMIKPYARTNDMSVKETEFNVKHSSNRMIVENIFSWLKEWFPRLHYHLEVTTTQKAVLIITTCIHLYNFILMERGTLKDANVGVSAAFVDSTVCCEGDGNEKRNRIAEHLASNGSVCKSCLQ